VITHSLQAVVNCNVDVGSSESCQQLCYWAEYLASK